MINEVRTYEVKPGAVAQWEGHFADALPNRVKYSELAALWHTEIGPLNQVIHVWPYENLEHRAEVRAKAAQEPGWPPKGGDLLLSMDSQIWTPAPFSPALGGNRKLGNVYEMRIYEIPAGIDAQGAGGVGEVAAQAARAVADCRLHVHRHRRPQPVDAHLAVR